MADKLSMTDLRRAVMVRTGATEQEISTFHNALKEQIVEALRKDKQVKINGLGTFRLQAIAPRKSVNIATGETITIEGYNKLTFVPEVSIKELVGNNPLQEEKAVAKPQPAAKQADGVAFDPIKKLGEQADEIVDILATLGQGPKADPQPAEPHPSENTEEPISVLEEAEVLPTEETEQPIEEEQQKEEEEIEQTERAQEESAQTAETPLPISASDAEKETKDPEAESSEKEAPIEAVQPEQPQQPEEKKEPEQIIEVVSPETKQPTEKKQTTTAEKKAEKPKKKYHFLRDTLICVCCLLLLLVGGFVFLRESLSRWVDSLNSSSSTNTEVSVIPTDTLVATDTDTTDSIAEQAAPTELIYNEFIATEQVRDGSRLAQIARRHYGDDKIDLWVYIYDANKEVLGNPNDIKVGTELRIPRLSDQQMDLTNPATQEEIQRLKAQIQSRTE